MSCEEQTKNVFGSFCWLCFQICTDDDIRILPCRHIFCPPCLRRQSFDNEVFHCCACKKLRVFQIKEIMSQEKLNNFKENLETEKVYWKNINFELKRTKLSFEKKHDLDNGLEILIKDGGLYFMFSVVCLTNGNYDNFTKELMMDLSNTIQRLDFTECDLKDEHIKDISNALSYICCLRSINFEKNVRIGFTNDPIFENLCRSSLTLETLNFNKCGLNEENIKKLSKLLSYCLFLKKINLGSNERIGSTDYPIFQNLLQSSATLEDLNFDSCNLNERNIKKLSRLFFSCSNLSAVSLAYNRKIGKTKYPVFKNLHYSTDTLNLLNLEECDLNEDNIENIAQLFSFCSNLNAVFLGKNQNIGKTTYPIFKNLCKTAKILNILCFEECDLNENNIKNICNLLIRCPKLNEVSFRYNKNLGKTKYPIFKSLLSSAKTLNILNLEDCALSKDNIKNVSDLFFSCFNLNAVSIAKDQKIGKNKINYNQSSKSWQFCKNITCFKFK